MDTGRRRPASDLIRQKYLDSARKLRSSLPAEAVTLYEASKGRLSVRLQSGELHHMDKSEVERLLNAVPPYFWKLVKIPVVLRYEKPGGKGPARYVVLGGPWQRRLVEIMLRGDFSERGVEALTVSDFQRIAGKYSSLLFVSISV